MAKRCARTASLLRCFASPQVGGTPRAGSDPQKSDVAEYDRLLHCLNYLAYAGTHLQRTPHSRSVAITVPPKPPHTFLFTNSNQKSIRNKKAPSKAP